MEDFLIQTSEPHTRLTIERIGDEMISIHTNCRTIMLSTYMAEEILKGLMATLKGGFTRALSETSLRLEEEEISRRNNRALPLDALSLREGSNRPEGAARSIPKPELDQL